MYSVRYIPLQLHKSGITDCTEGKIVGIQYYDGYASRGESVLVKREPNNQYDRNAIRIDNVVGQQIGHIPRKIAAKLSAYLVVTIPITYFLKMANCPRTIILYS